MKSGHSLLIAITFIQTSQVVEELSGHAVNR